MYSKGFFVAVPLLSSLLPVLVFSEPVYDAPSKQDAKADYDSFQKILEQVDPSSLHSALHEYSPKKFEHGMFREDKTAMEAIHRESAPLATSIINLAKRQAGNATVISSTPSVAPTVITDTKSLSPSASSTDSDIDTVSATTAPKPTTSASDASSDTSTTPLPGSSAPPTTITSTSTGPSSATATSETPISKSTTSSAAQDSQSKGSVVTKTDSSGVVVVTTIGGGASTVGSSSQSATGSSSTSSSPSSTTAKKLTTSQAIHTTVLPNGSRSTVTAITVVPGNEDATPSGDAGVTQGSKTGTASPRLQTGVAVRTGNVMKEILCVVGGAVGVAMLM